MSIPVHIRKGNNYSGNSFSATYADSVIGTILAYGGTTAPYGWFLCQGQAISRTEYSELFEVIGTSFGAGDGSTTFNLPDLRGEFLRGAGNNSHADQGNGGTVGEHQDGTETPFFGFNQNTGDLWCQTSAGQNLDISLGVIETDTLKSTTNKTGRFWKQSNAFTGDGSSTYTSRPTNTSVNFIIKAKYSASPAGDVLGVQDIRDTLGETPIPSDLGTTVTGALSNIGNRFNYSTEEQVVGKWIDGKPIYQKIIPTTLPTMGTSKNVDIGASIEFVVDYKAIIITGANGRGFTVGSFACQDADSTSYSKVYIYNYLGQADGSNPNAAVIWNHIKVNTWDNCPCVLIVQYTKTTD